MSDNWNLVIAAKPAKCQSAVEAFHEFAARKGLSKAVVFDIHLVLDELLSNITNHGFVGREPDEGRIELRMRLHGSLLEIRIEDNGLPFNLLDREDPPVRTSLKTTPIGGLGVHLVKNMLDRIEYTRKGSLNILRLQKTVSFDQK